MAEEGKADAQLFQLLTNLLQEVLPFFLFFFFPTRLVSSMLLLGFADSYNLIVMIFI